MSSARFDIVRHLGSGGMGSVYEAFDREAGRGVAIKRLDRCEPQHLLGFKREFREFRHLHHPNVVALHELFSDGTEWFFSMELLDGVDWLSHVRPSLELPVVDDDDATLTAETLPRERSARRRRAWRGALDEERLRSSLLQLVRGVQAIHDAGKLHRDLKPSNIVVTRDGRVVVVDFGIALDSDAVVGGEPVSGTLAYMAPEQAAGRACDAAADWYSVGVMLREALTGQRAADDLARLCEHLLAADPRDRPTGPEILARLGCARDRPRVVPRGPARAPRGLLLRGECSRNERVPYNAFDAIVDALSAHLASRPDVAGMLPDNIAVLARTFPVLWAVPAVRAAAPGSRGDVRDLLVELLHRVAHHTPLVLVIAGVHRADADSRAVLDVLWADAPAPGLVVMGCDD